MKDILILVDEDFRRRVGVRGEDGMTTVERLAIGWAGSQLVWVLGLASGTECCVRYSVSSWKQSCRKEDSIWLLCPKRLLEVFGRR